MKTAIYIEDGVMQLVLTPQNDFERDALRSFGDGPTKTTIFEGAFYDCRGGWVRQTEQQTWRLNNQQDRSLIVRTEKQQALADQGKEKTDAL